jgi:hypothetical protein
MGHSNQIAATAGALFASRGYKKKGALFVKRFVSTFVVVRVIFDKYGNKQNGRVTFDFSGGSKLLFDACPTGFAEYKEDFGMFPFSARVGLSRKERAKDCWFSFSETDSAETQLARNTSVVQLLTADCELIESIFFSDDSIIAFLRSENCFGISQFAAERYTRVMR